MLLLLLLLLFRVDLHGRRGPVGRGHLVIR